MRHGAAVIMRKVLARLRPGPAVQGQKALVIDCEIVMVEMLVLLQAATGGERGVGVAVARSAAEKHLAHVLEMTGRRQHLVRAGRGQLGVTAPYQETRPGERYPVITFHAVIQQPARESHLTRHPVAVEMYDLPKVHVHLVQAELIGLVIAVAPTERALAGQHVPHHVAG